MTCKRVKSNLPSYVEGTLGDRTAARVAAHLLDCNACRTEKRKIALVMEVVTSLPEVRCTPTFTASVLRKVRLVEVRVPTTRQDWGLRLAVAGAAAMVLAAVVVLPRVRELVQPTGTEPAVASRRGADEFVLPVTDPEDRLARWEEFGTWTPAQGRVRVSLVLDQNVTPRIEEDQVYVLDRQDGWAASLRSTL